MTFAHLLLTKTAETKTSVEYEAVTPDFNEAGNWQPVARIVIDKASGDYDFVPINEWAALHLVHPKLYALTDEERASRIEEGASCGAWTGRINAWVTRLVEGQAYPSTYPG